MTPPSPSEGAKVPEPWRLTQEPNECYATCIAAIAHISVSVLPPVPENIEDDSVRMAYYTALNAALYEQGWCMVRHYGKGAPAGFAIASGTSPRGISHAVIVKDGILWHDPHPSRAGVVGDFTRYEILYRVVNPDRWASHPNPHGTAEEVFGIATPSTPPSESPTIAQPDGN